MPLEMRLPVASDTDVVLARERGRKIAAEAGFSRADQCLIATAISEVARNIVQYAGRGQIQLSILQDKPRGLLVIASDEGPGIADLKLALQDGYSTGGGLGLGLPGAKRLMDEFEIVSEVGKGTTITMKKWVF